MTQVSTYQRAALEGDEAQYIAFVNGVIQALATDSAGAVAPTETYALMSWLDTSTSPPTLKRRNAANSDWDIALAFASEGEAEAGTNETKAMSPLRVAQAIAELAPVPNRASLNPIGRVLCVADNGDISNTYNITTASSGVDLSTVGQVRFDGGGNAGSGTRYVSLGLSSDGGSSWSSNVILATITSKVSNISGYIDLESGEWSVVAVETASDPSVDSGTFSGGPFNAIRFTKTSGASASMIVAVVTGR